MFKPSKKYDELIALYARMVEQGYERRLGERVENAFSDQEAAKFRHELKRWFSEHNIRSVLDYGAGGSAWDKKAVSKGVSLRDFLGIAEYRVFEPSRAIDDRRAADAVVCFDVLEHVYLADIGYVLNELFELSERLLILNVATYAANALLPTGENAHVTQRPAHWWRGVVELIAAAHPEVTAVLYVSESYNKAKLFDPICFNAMNAKSGFVR